MTRDEFSKRLAELVKASGQEGENCMTRDEFNKYLVELVKASGQEVIDRAEDLVGHGKLMTDFGIHLIFSIDGRSVVDAVPEITVTRSYISERAVQKMNEH